MKNTYKISENGSIKIAAAFLLICLFPTLNGQTDKKYIRQGNREYNKNGFSDSEISYRKAADKNSQSADAVFNIGDALYKQEKFEEAGKQFEENIVKNEDKSKKSAGYYNLGNSLLKANKVEESINAYKNSLKLKPDNTEAKYNLAYAQDLLKKQQEQQQKDKDKENKDNKDDKKDDQKKDQGDDKKDQQKNQNDKDQQQQKKDQQGMSKEDAQRLLNALANDEKKVQEKVKLAKAEKAKVRTVKNW
jgi:Ca-activated chloride channel homolog